MAYKLKVGPSQSLKLKGNAGFALPLLGGDAISTSKSGGIWTVDLDYSEVQTGSTVNDATAYVLTWDSASGLFTRLNVTDLKVEFEGTFDGYYQPLDATLTALAALDSTAGLLVQTGADTFARRTLTGTANEITVTDGAGTAGNPTVSLPASLTFTGKTVTGGTFDNPTIKINGNTLAASAGTATVTIPNATDTLVGRDTTDTLTNKTLTSPVINSPTGIVKGDVGLGNVPNVDATNASNITSGSLGVSVSQTPTGNFYTSSGARINRLADRVFIADAVYHDGENTASNGDWLTTFQLGIGRANGFVQSTQSAILQSTAAGSNSAHGLVIGAQTAHFTSTGNAAGSTSVSVNNNSSQTTNAYASYNEAYRMSGAIGGAYGYEIDTVNYASSVSIDPFTQSIGQTIGMQIAAGAELSATGQFSSSAAINIRNNNSNYNSGIVFGNDAIAGTAGNDGGIGPAIEMATGHAIWYYYSSSNVSWQLYAGVGADGDYNFTSNGTGAVSVPSLKSNGVKFPATQVASSDANTLDDYEEGTFTPTITLGGASTGITYSSQLGKYTKIGNIVHTSAQIILTSKGTATGNMEIAGLPFAVSTYVSSACSVRCANLAASATTDLQGLFGASTTTANITRYSGGTATQLADTDLTNTSVIRISGIYFVD